MAILPPVVLIPSFNPPPALLDLGERLREFFEHIVIVDDGSHGTYEPVFGAMRQKGLIVLRHEVNRGKGQALKTGLGHIDGHFRGRGAITADDDGQHDIKDIVLVGQRLKNMGARGFVLGERNLNTKKVPFSSRVGNQTARILTRGFFRSKVRDTQTGLRAIGADLIQEFISISGNRYEYEMAILLYCLHKGIKITRVPIKTIYSRHRRGHFRKYEDSYLVCRTIFKHYLKGPTP